MTPYQHLESRFARLAVLSDALGILGWDMETMMPAGAAEGRAEQVAALEVMHHEMMTDPRLADWLAEAEQQADTLGDWHAANLREMRRKWVHANAVPSDLVDASSRARSRCLMVWREARPASDFKAVLPSLSEVLNCQRAIAEAKADALNVSAYDALLDSYEPDGRAAEIDAVFDELATFLPGFIEAVLERQAREPAPVAPQGPFPIDIQKALGKQLMEAVGFDFSRGRLDVSLHPFCGGASDDVRITTRYDEAEFYNAMMGVLHESGHAMYEQGRPRDFLFQPVGQARGMAMHESQSLIVEMQAGRSRAFTGWLAPRLREAFGGASAAWEADNLYRLSTQVERSFIRVDADEVTYPAHVILRYRLERAMISGSLALADLPDAWNAGMKELLGIVPPDDRLGCLQDIHWCDGLWGYFPTYSLGAMTAAQLFDAAWRADSNITPALGHGDFGPLMAWLRREVHSRGSLMSTRDLLIAATGKPLDADVFKSHMRQRYLLD